MLTPVCVPAAGGTAGGAAIVLQSGCTDVCTIRNNSFVENQAVADGGAVYLQVSQNPGPDPDPDQAPALNTELDLLDPLSLECPLVHWCPFLPPSDPPHHLRPQSDLPSLHLIRNMTLQRMTHVTQAPENVVLSGNYFRSNTGSNTGGAVSFAGSAEKGSLSSNLTSIGNTYTANQVRSDVPPQSTT